MKKSLRRPKDCHKGDFGHAWIVAGSSGMAGAGCLAAAAAMRSGAGRTTWVTTREAYRVMGRAIPEVMSLTFQSDARGSLPARAIPHIVRRALAAAQAVGIGPGLGRTPAVRRLVQAFLAQSRVPLILDADALWALEGDLESLKKSRAPVVLTPHAGEFARLFGTHPSATASERSSVAKRIANQYHCVLVCKGPASRVVLPGGKSFVNTTGNPGMAKGGSGDVLTGIIAGLAAQGFDAGSAARIGVRAHGRAADLAAKSGSLTALAPSDLLRFLPVVWAELETKKDLLRYARPRSGRGQ